MKRTLKIVIKIIRSITHGKFSKNKVNFQGAYPFDGNTLRRMDIWSKRRLVESSLTEKWAQE